LGVDVTVHTILIKDVRYSPYGPHKSLLFIFIFYMY